jgi:CheY-like chemotaxis protein
LIAFLAAMLLTPEVPADQELDERWAHGLTVAVVDDDPGIRLLLARVLSGLGCHVEVFDRSATALARLHHLRSHGTRLLLVTDLYLENETGVALLRRVRRECGDLPVLLMSGGGERELLIEAMRLRCSGFIEKPFTPRQVARSVRAACPPPPEADQGPPAVDAPSWEEATAAELAGDYELVDLLASGGMGVVYRARQRDLDRLVALKVLRQDRSLDAQRPLLLREARLMAQLRHPNVAIVHTVGQLKGLDFYSMELIEGVTLEKRLRGFGPLDPRAAVELLTPIGDGLATAHDRGILHHDVKPANIVIEACGRPVLVDFGVAGRKGDDELSEERFGTLEYSAPENLDGFVRDERSDTYSLACTLYETLAGFRNTPLLADEPRPYSHHQALRVIERNDPIPIERFVPDLDPRLSTILSRGLAPLEERLTVRELVWELSSWLETQP